MFDRKVFLVRPKKRLSDILHSLDDDLQEALKYPVVIMTEKLSFEQDLEGWRLCIIEVAKDRFIEELEKDILHSYDIESTLGEVTRKSDFFDMWFELTEVDFLEINGVVWKANRQK